MTRSPQAGSSPFVATFSPGNPAALFYRLSRLAGLAAFTLVVFQVLTGPYMKFWEALYGTSFYRFHAYEGLLALLIALLHPGLLVLSLGYSKTSLSRFTQNIPFQFYFGPLALLLMLATVSTAGLAVILGRPRFKRGWHAIHLANYAVFILAFFHSVTIGTDLTSPKNPLRPMWAVFFIAMILGFLNRRRTSKTPSSSTGLTPGAVRGIRDAVAAVNDGRLGARRTGGAAGRLRVEPGRLGTDLTHRDRRSSDA